MTEIFKRRNHPKAECGFQHHRRARNWSKSSKKGQCSTQRLLVKGLWINFYEKLVSYKRAKLKIFVLC